MVYVDRVNLLSSDKTKSEFEYLYYRTDKDKGYKLPELEDNELVLTQSQAVEDYYSTKGIPYTRLSNYLGIGGTYGLYELFSLLYEGKVDSDFDMIRLLLTCSVSKSCYCLKIGSTICIFDVSNGVVAKHGTLQFSEKPSKYTVGRFIKRLRYLIASAGYNFRLTKYLCWTARDYCGLEDYIADYIELKSSVFSNIEGLGNLSLRSLLEFLGKGRVDSGVTAEALVDCLKASSKELGLAIDENGRLITRSSYLRNYTETSVTTNKKTRYFVVLDTEGVKGSDGKLTNGVSEIGGLICTQNRGIIGVENSFYSDRVLLNDTLKTVIHNKVFSGMSRVPFLVYGSADELLLNNSDVDKWVLSRINFVDVQDYVQQGVKLDKFSLGNLASYYSVRTFFPKHNPLNDAKTLFNILADKLRRTGRWVI